MGKYTFEQWCLDNDKTDLLNRWDYEMTGFGPGDITYASAKFVFFKCPKKIHESEKRRIYVLTSKSSKQHTFRCKQCMEELNIRHDLTGDVYGSLTVLEPDVGKTKANHDGTYWFCKCSCGSIVSYLGTHLKNGSCTTCGDKSVHRVGSNNSNWKGGVTPRLLCDRSSKEYEQWRDTVYSKDWYTCQCCGAYGNDIEKNAHHIKNFSEYDDIKYDVANGMCLCANCHHIKNVDSYHNIYGTRGNTPQQLEEYINKRRKKLGIYIPFSIDEYLSGKILKPDDIRMFKQVC